MGSEKRNKCLKNKCQKEEIYFLSNRKEEKSSVWTKAKDKQIETHIAMKERHSEINLVSHFSLD